VAAAVWEAACRQAREAQQGAGSAVAVLLLAVVLGISVGASFVIPRGSRGILIGLLVGLT